MRKLFAFSAVAAAAALPGTLVIAQGGVQEVTIGSAAPMSGAQAHYGKDNDNGVRMAVEAILTKGPGPAMSQYNGSSC